MKTIKLILGTIGFIIALLFAVKAHSADAQSTAKAIAEVYKAGEVNVETGYSVRTEDFGEYEGNTYIGGNYLITKNAGVHVGATGGDDLDESAVKEVEFGLLGRLSKDFVALDFGIGAIFDIKPDDWAVYAEAGPRLRFAKKVDLFAKVRGIRPIESAEKESVAVIGGLGYSF